MEFLNYFVLPQSAEHIELLHYMLLIVLFLFIPFISIVFGGIFLSVVYKYKAKNLKDNFYLRLSKDVAEITTINKCAGFIFGVVPLLTAILIYSQLLHNSEMQGEDYMPTMRNLPQVWKEGGIWIKQGSEDAKKPKGYGNDGLTFHFFRCGPATGSLGLALSTN